MCISHPCLPHGARSSLCRTSATLMCPPSLSSHDSSLWFLHLDHLPASHAHSLNSRHAHTCSHPLPPRSYPAPPLCARSRPAASLLSIQPISHCFVFDIRRSLPHWLLRGRPPGSQQFVGGSEILHESWVASLVYCFTRLDVS